MNVTVSVPFWATLLLTPIRFMGLMCGLVIIAHYALAAWHRYVKCGVACRAIRPVDSNVGRIIKDLLTSFGVITLGFTLILRPHDLISNNLHYFMLVVGWVLLSIGLMTKVILVSINPRLMAAVIWLLAIVATFISLLEGRVIW